MDDLIQKLKELKERRIASRVKHLRGRHDQRDHNRWPAGYVAQSYVPTGRRGDLMSSRASGQLGGGIQQTAMVNLFESKLPSRYDATRFDEPSEFAPMPIRKEMMMPNGAVYESLKSVYESGDFVAVNSENHNLLVAYALSSDGSKYFPSSRWHINFAELSDMHIQKMQDILQSKRVNRSTSPFSQSQMYSEFRLKKEDKQSAENAISDNNPYIIMAIERLKHEYGDSNARLLKDRIARVTSNAKQVIHAYELSKQMDYNQLNNLASKQYRYFQNLITQFENELKSISQDSQNNPDDKDLRQKEVMMAIQLRNAKTVLSMYSSMFSDSGEVKPLSMRQIIESLPATTVSSALYDVYGYHEKPKAISWNDLSSGKSYTLNGQSAPLMLYRSIRGAADFRFASSTSSNAIMTANEIHDATLNSERAHVGLGIHGMGMYWKSRDDNVSKSPEESDGVALMDGRKQYGDYTFAGIIKENSRIFDENIARYGRRATGESMIVELQNEFTSRFGDIFGGSFPDVGIMMTMLGWEGYRVKADYEGSFDWVILNRAAMIISQEMITPDTPQDVIDKAFRTGRI